MLNPFSTNLILPDLKNSIFFLCNNDNQKTISHDIIPLLKKTLVIPCIISFCNKPNSADSHADPPGTRFSQFFEAQKTSHLCFADFSSVLARTFGLPVCRHFSRFLPNKNHTKTWYKTVKKGTNMRTHDFFSFESCHLHKVHLVNLTTEILKMNM